MMRELVRFYGKDVVATEDEMKLASAAKGLSAEREATAAMAKAEDRVDIQEHIRRYHGGKLEPGESCPFLDKLHRAEEDFGTLDPKDANGDGEADFAEEEEKEESEAEVSEDSADAVKAYFDAVAKDEFSEGDHPREAKGGKGGGQFAKKPETLEKEDSRDVLNPEEGVDPNLSRVKDALKGTAYEDADIKCEAHGEGGSLYSCATGHTRLRQGPGAEPTTLHAFVHPDGKVEFATTDSTGRKIGRKEESAQKAIENFEEYCNYYRLDIRKRDSGGVSDFAWTARQYFQ